LLLSFESCADSYFFTTIGTVRLIENVYQSLVTVESVAEAENVPTIMMTRIAIPAAINILIFMSFL